MLFKKFLFKLLTGYLPALIFSELLLMGLILGSRSWAAVLAGGSLFLVWGAGNAVLMLGVFFLKRSRYFFVKSLAYSIVSLVAAPFLVMVAIEARNLILYSEPSHEILARDLTTESDICHLERIDKSKRMGPDGFYYEATVSCRGLTSRKCAWWYSYHNEHWRRMLWQEYGCLSRKDGSLNAISDTQKWSLD